MNCARGTGKNLKKKKEGESQTQTHESKTQTKPTLIGINYSSIQFSLTS